MVFFSLKQKEEEEEEEINKEKIHTMLYLYCI